MEISKELAELVGIIIGDGNIYQKHHKYRVGFVGDINNDKLYFNYIKDLIKKEWDKEARIFIGGRGIRIVINSKRICQMLINELKLPYGEGKYERAIIPEIIAKNWNLAKHTIRGIIDTDGSVFVSKKPRVAKYPCIEISTNSDKLAIQLKRILEEKKFRVNKIRRSTSKMSAGITNRIALNGKSNLQKWLNEIGFSNPYKLERAISYLK